MKNDVITHWNRCLEVNSSWREFTHELAVLNTFDTLTASDCEFVADLLLDTELFQDADYGELLLSCFEFASELSIPIADIDCSDLTILEESGLSQDEVIALAADIGVSEVSIADYANE